MEKEDTMIDDFMKANNWHVADRLMLPAVKADISLSMIFSFPWNLPTF